MRVKIQGNAEEATHEEYPAAVKVDDKKKQKRRQKLQHKISKAKGALSRPSRWTRRSLRSLRSGASQERSSNDDDADDDDDKSAIGGDASPMTERKATDTVQRVGKPGKLLHACVVMNNYMRLSRVSYSV